MTATGWAVMTTVVLGLAAAAVAAVRVPWRRPPAPRADQLAALADLPPDAVARGRTFRRAIRPTSYASLALGLAVALVFGLTHLGSIIVTAVARPLGGGWFVQALVGGFVIVLIGEVVSLPLAVWREIVTRRFGLSTQTWRSWTIDLLKGYGVGAVIGAVVLIGFFGAGQAAPVTWWVWVAAGAAGLTVLFSFVFPVLVEPIFNRFTPMPDGPLRDGLLALAARDGVPVRDVLVADASRRTNALNAYVSGLGPTRRIVVFDTLLREAPPSEVESVVAHELGHAKARDVVTGTAIGALGAATAICVLPLIDRWTGLLRLAGVSSIVDPRAVALLLALGAVFGLVAAPAQSYVSRLIEARADDHALRLTNDPSTVEEMERRLATVNLADVDPPVLEHVMFASHPSVVQRMAAARAFARGER
jgi:Zn-dependent protease with chaperone function